MPLRAQAIDPTSDIPGQSAQAWIGRQPIFDRNLEICGYELLYRDGPENRARIVDADRASSQTLLHAFLEMGIDDLCGPHRAYVNLTQEVILSDVVEALPKHRVVLEVLETVGASPKIVERLRELRTAGFRLALDDFTLTDETEPLLELADVVKLDLRALDPDALLRHTEAVRASGAHLLAEKVETADELKACQDLGFHYFQGYYLSLPEVRSRRRSSASRAAVLRLLTKVQSADTPLGELEELFGADVSLTYRILRFLNSSLFARAHRIESVRHAITMLGRDRLRRWVTLIALAGLDDEPPPLLTTALVRARMCERLAEVRGDVPPGSAFTVGLFSALDALLGLPMKAILDELPLSDDLNAALTQGRGALGTLLRASLDYEAGDWHGIDLLGLPPSAFPDAYFQAVRWAEDHLRALV